nr:TolC family protein [Gemmatimonadaceae bacterium]
GAGREAIARAQGDSATLVAQLDADVATSWWLAVRAEALAQVARSQREALDDVARYDSLRAREGAVAEVVALRARVEADRAALAEVGARAERARARALLARYVGQAGDSLALAVDTSAAAALTAIADVVHDAPPVPGPPELRAAEAAEREQRRRVAAERLALVPDLTLTAGSKQTGPLRYTVVAVALPLPLLNRNGGARERTQAELLAVQAQRRDVVLRVRREGEAADAARRALREAPPPREILARTAEAASIARAAYREGGITQLELFEAQRAEGLAREAVLRWATDVHLADVAWRRATGRPQEGP